MSWAHDLAARALRGLDPETAHDLTIAGLKTGLGPRESHLDDPGLAVTIGGMKVDNCIGLAAGFDKNAEVPDAMLAAGFGFVECGTVTPLPQPGNPRPRLFRLSEERAVINRMGFNNEGLEPFAARLAARRSRPGVVGANIGANKDSADRVGDYVIGLQRLWELADYFTVNVSSPNTPGLRALQGRGALDALLGRIAEAREALVAQAPDRPIFLKVAPDLTDPEVEDVTAAVLAHGLNGIIVGNTTLDRSGVDARWREEAGGLSGAPLMEKSTQVLRRFHEMHDNKLVLIGVGGVASGADAYAKIRAGACVIQLYTAMVFNGPSLVARIKRDLCMRLRADGFSSVVEALGAV